MMLSELKNSLEKERVLSLFDITQRFNINADLARLMLSRLIQKGCVIKCKKTPACGIQCQQCSELVTELYQWKQS